MLFNYDELTFEDDMMVKQQEQIDSLTSARV